MHVVAGSADSLRKSPHAIGETEHVMEKDDVGHAGS
jgi:hypothetical protein